MIPLALVIARRGNAGALFSATAPRPRPTVFSGAALVAVAVFFFVLGALVGAGLGRVSTAPSSEKDIMSGRRFRSSGAGLEVVHMGVHPGVPVPGNSRLDRRVKAAREKREARRAKRTDRAELAEAEGG